jgi:hypothetical protein
MYRHKPLRHKDTDRIYVKQLLLFMLPIRTTEMTYVSTFHNCPDASEK